MKNIIKLNGIDYIEILAKTNDKICKDCDYFLNNGKCTLDECPCKIKSYTDLEQSKKLAEILPKESADYCWGIDEETMCYNCSPYPLPWKDYTAKEYYVPCWSLAALLTIIPRGILMKTIPDYDGDDKLYVAFDAGIASENCDNPVDACVEMICKLKENGLL